MRCRLRYLLAASLLCGSLTSAGADLALAQAPPLDAGVDGGPAPVEDQRPEPPPAPTVKDLEQQTARIRALMARRLDPNVDPASLFTLALHDPGAVLQTQTVLEKLEEGMAPPRRGKRGELTATLQRPASDAPIDIARWELAQAQLAFLSLPAEERRRLLSEHERRRRAASRNDEFQQGKVKRLAELEVTARQLESFLAGTLDPTVDPRPLLQVELLAADELALDERRRRSFLDGDAAEPIPPEDLEKLGIDAKIDVALARIDAQRRRFLALEPKARDKLFDRHRNKQLDRLEAAAAEVDDAEEAVRRAAEERQQAIEDKEVARSETRKLVADQRAALLAVKEDQALYAASLAKQRSQVEAVLESALAWTRRVKELEEAALDRSARSRAADELYPQLVRDLSQARDALRTVLSLTTSGERPVPAPPANDTRLFVDLDDGTLRTLRGELLDETARLEAERSELRWHKAKVLRDSVVLMNKARLRLFEHLGKQERVQLTGFGPESLDQVKRELDQITLEARYSLLSLPRELGKLRERLRTSPGSAVAMPFQVLLLLLAFIWWRRNADSVLLRIQQSWLQRRPQTGLTRAVAGLAWYSRRIRKPLEWFIVLGILSELIVARFGTLLELTYLRIVVIWALAGAFLVRLVDAIADRQGRSSEFSSKLRFRSLRLVGVMVVLVGLVLSITTTTVGKGAIHAWVIKTFWFLAIPVGVVLVLWWSRTIFERASARESSGVLSWVSRHSSGPLKLVAAPVGGTHLLVDGVYRFLVTRATELAPARSLLAYLSRREVEKQGLATTAESGTAPIPPELYEKMSPEAAPEAELVRSYMSPEVHAMRALVRSERASIVAVIGERGEGKSTFLGRVVSDLDVGASYEVRCEQGGFAGVVAQLAVALDLPEGSTEAQVIERLNERAPKVVSIDDAHRLIKPLIGGLKDIDDLIRFMRGGHPASSWLIGISMPAWQYLRRARAQRTGFDEVVELLPWEEEQIVKLVEARNEAAGVSPCFDELVVPQQFAVSRELGSDRTQRDFFRILWDYSGGNPFVALYFWRESLYVRPSDQRIHVRIPKVPSARDLDEQPNALYFVLRTITQLERASEGDIVRCTDLGHADVADALRAAKVHGYVVEHDGLFEISTQWYRAVTGILRRKHLMLL